MSALVATARVPACGRVVCHVCVCKGGEEDAGGRGGGEPFGHGFMEIDEAHTSRRSPRVSTTAVVG